MGCKQLDACGSLVNWSNHLQLKNPISTELWRFIIAHDAHRRHIKAHLLMWMTEVVTMMRAY
ncbi:hypothetical protein HanRHA438_Chr07g0312951 [Helianthus annuus]|nr:hypothetical protein HanRHA438_Chr07g0312951 [Helianthus annuus]